MPDDKDLLIPLAYPGGREAFDAHVLARVAAGASWRTIAGEVNDHFLGGVKVSREWLRQQYREAGGMTLIDAGKA